MNVAELFVVRCKDRYVFWNTITNTYDFTPEFRIAALFYDFDSARALRRSARDWTPDIRQHLQVVKVTLYEGGVVTGD